MTTSEDYFVTIATLHGAVFEPDPVGWRCGHADCNPSSFDGPCGCGTGATPEQAALNYCIKHGLITET